MVVYNHPVEMQCAPGTRFNLSIGVCDHASNVECVIEIDPDVRDPPEAPKGVTIPGTYFLRHKHSKLSAISSWVIIILV